MKLLLDESVPRKLARYFPAEIEVRTVPQMGWTGTKNGKLLELTALEGFDALITADQGIEYQQNTSAIPVSIVILRAHRTRVQDLSPLVPQVIEVLERHSNVGVYRVTL